MIIGDFDFVGVTIFPSEADAPLVVDSYAVLAVAVASKSFETVAGWNSERVDGYRSV